MPSQHSMYALSLVAALLLSLPLAAEHPAGPERLDGRWRLDWNASDPFEPVMEALEVPWLVRKLAGVASVTIVLEALPPECEGCPLRVRSTQESPLSDSVRVLVLDGNPRPGEDPTGNDTLDAYTWNDASLAMVRLRDLSGGRKARIEEHRRLGDEVDTLISEMRVWVDDVERASVRRVLRRATD